MIAKEEDEQTVDASDDSNDEVLRDLLNSHRRQRFDDNEAHKFLVEMLSSFSSSHRQPTANGRKTDDDKTNDNDERRLQ